MAKRILLLFILPLVLSQNLAAQIVEIEYTGFTVWLDCDYRGAVRFEYIANADNGNFPRQQNFVLDKKTDIEDRCQQTSSNAYSGGPNGYDRGHLVPANHLDHDREAISQSNYMTNILPQHRNMNRGAWLLTEEIIECVRDISPLHIIGGVLWGYNPHDDDFVESHGVKTPDYFWKLIIREVDGEAIAWMVPNMRDARRSELDKYLISVSELEEITGEEFEVSNAQRQLIREKSWQKPDGCDLS